MIRILLTLIIINFAVTIPLLAEEGAEGGKDLIQAVKKGTLSDVRDALESEKNINGKDVTKGETAIMHASKKGRVKVVRLLIDAGSDVRLKNKEGLTALDLVEKKLEKYEKIKVLLKKALRSK